MQALYQLSYSPGTVHATGTRTAVSIPVPRTPPDTVDTNLMSAVVAEHRLRQGSRVVLDQPPLPVPT